MLFNSIEFVFLFMPTVLALVALMHRAGLGRYIPVVLLCASAGFYAWWNVNFLGLLAISIVANYGLSRLMVAQKASSIGGWLLAIGLTGNLLALSYFKYAEFLMSILTGHSSSFDSAGIILPLGISFYTFTQITYLIDAHQRQIESYDFVTYALFVTYFPHLICGPILHHRDMMPQFAAVQSRGLVASDVALGLGIFAIGLFKKLIVADNIGFFANEFYDSMGAGRTTVSAVEAWSGALAYSLQLYFDFSGYSDMAMGVSRMFGVNLPFNFASPFKATSIIEYWRRWHISLTNLITAYIFNPIVLAVMQYRQREKLPGIRRGKAETFGAFLALVAAPTVISMTLAGVWHGAGWQFVAFGLLHGLYLSINHFWRMIDIGSLAWIPRSEIVRIWAARLVTLIAVVIAHVFFRADTLDTAFQVLLAMVPHGDIAFAGSSDAVSISQIALTLVLLAFVWWGPGTHEIVANSVPGPKGVTSSPLPGLVWRFDWPWLVATGVVLGMCAPFMLGQAAKFLYFQF